MPKPRLKTAYLLDLKEYDEGGYLADLYFDLREVLKLAAAILNVASEGHERFVIHVHRSGVQDYPSGSVFVEGR